MGFIDNVSVFTKGVGAKAKGNYDVVAMNAQISSTKREINELYQKIGEAYYKEHATSPESMLTDFVNQITTKLEHIDELNKQIEIKKEETASVQLIATGDNTVVADTQSGRKCIKCGAILKDDDLFCPECGTKNEIEEVKVTDVVEATEAEANDSPQKIKCPTCGVDLTDEDVFCPECGSKIK